MHWMWMLYYVLCALDALCFELDAFVWMGNWGMEFGEQKKVLNIVKSNKKYEDEMMKMMMMSLKEHF